MYDLTWNDPFIHLIFQVSVKEILKKVANVTGFIWLGMIK